jgi:uncharacterized membrane protein YkoI
MNTMRYAVIGTLAASALVGTLVYASQTTDRDHAMAPEQRPGTISLTQAIAVAEQHAQGQAVGGELARNDGRAVYEVEVANAGRVIEVKVDAVDGTVIGAEADRSDDDAAERQRDRS